MVFVAQSVLLFLLAASSLAASPNPESTNGQIGKRQGTRDQQVIRRGTCVAECEGSATGGNYWTDPDHGH
ncbi:hypothetical protein MJO28_014265 [Puccinia striiformis f. sp. tritici]|uniref:Uncharacterized protein n=1 Tax=Puccinia striiformis f. sp. tritici TaxID=168172 RepID=A0ACC0DTN9_9BASI|nr:hypothetical protein MJO28_014265 [Puccinia striiformis f. sp. tritici]KAI9626304.1 hypothetical protein KEM48_010556 [Puccinia striiformis f. sp. tritici PST-130]